jgi:hypothetical protein
LWFCCCPAGPTKGLFTSTNPELRRVVPDDVAGRVKVKVVYTVLEAQYQSALSAAVQQINKTNKTVSPLWLMGRHGSSERSRVGVQTANWLRCAARASL